MITLQIYSIRYDNGFGSKKLNTTFYQAKIGKHWCNKPYSKHPILVLLVILLHLIFIYECCDGIKNYIHLSYIYANDKSVRGGRGLCFFALHSKSYKWVSVKLCTNNFLNMLAFLKKHICVYHYYSVSFWSIDMKQG